jgi:hypothetical protein
MSRENVEKNGRTPKEVIAAPAFHSTYHFVFRRSCVLPLASIISGEVFHGLSARQKEMRLLVWGIVTRSLARVGRPMAHFRESEAGLRHTGTRQILKGNVPGEIACPPLRTGPTAETHFAGLLCRQVRNVRITFSNNSTPVRTLSISMYSST